MITLKIATLPKDKLYKLRPVVDSLNKSFWQSRNPREYLSIDESMIKFKGRSSMKQYNPMKPLKSGFKLWCMADDEGYIYKFEIYTGKNEENLNKGLGWEDRWLQTWQKTFIQKTINLFLITIFFSPPTITFEVKEDTGLWNNQTNKNGFTCAFRGQETQQRSTPIGITIYRWKDSKGVNLISSYHGIETTSVQRREKDGGKTSVSCPVVVKDSNNHMGGVDTHDMLRQIYGIHREIIKWWHMIFFGMLDMATVNSFLIYRESTGSFLTQMEFRRDLARAMLSFSTRSCSGVKRRKVGYYIPVSVRTANVGPNMPQFNVKSSGCEVCSMDGIESRPTSKCAFLWSESLL